MLNLQVACALQAAAAVAQSSSQQTSPVASHAPEPVAAGVAQMVLDPETGQYIVDPNSINMQAQPREQYSRRANNEEILINSMSHMRREASTRWTPEETEEFYSVSSTAPVCCCW